MPVWKMNPRLSVLLCAVVATVAVVLGTFGARRQMHNSIENAHLTRFNETGAVVVSNIAGVAEQYLGDPGRHQIELSALVHVVRSLPDSLGLSITGAHDDGPPNSYDYLWASSESRFRGPDGLTNYTAGHTRIEDELSPEVWRLRGAVNTEGEQELSELSAQIRQVSTQILRLLTEGGADREAEIEEMDAVFRVLYLRATERLAAVGARHSGRVPATPSLSDREVVFYHPVVVFDQSTDGWYAGMVRFRRSVAPVREAVGHEQQAADNTLAWRSFLLLAALWSFCLVLFIGARRS